MAIPMKPNGTASTPTRTGPDFARLIAFFVCIWLIVSAFAWRHAPVQTTNTWIVGVVGAVIALVSIVGDTRLRYLNTLLAIWLFISVWAFPVVQLGTVWNNVIVAIVLFLLSLSIPAGSGRGFRHA